jgi:hypothetical protein
LLTGVRQRVHAWNQELEKIAARGAELRPQDIPPSGAPLPSSAHVWAGRGDGGRPQIVVRRRVIKYIDVDSADLPSAIEAADQGMRVMDSSARLILPENGQVQAVTNDPHGIFERKVSSGLAHELSLPERGLPSRRSNQLGDDHR